MKILIACERSGVARRAFRAIGHDAWSCDLVPADDGSEFHIVGDAVQIANSSMYWDMMIAHPPCTYLTNTAVSLLTEKPGRFKRKPDTLIGPARFRAANDAANFFCALKNCDIERICIENPIPHGHARRQIGEYTQIINPWQFGHGETKKTCLWLKGLPDLIPSDIVSGRTPRVHYESPGIKNGLTRQQRRSVTFEGIAKAMAYQWGGFEQ